MGKTAKKTVARERRHHRVRKQIMGTAERPRLAVFKSLKHTYAQIINDDLGHTLASAGTTQSAMAEGLASRADIEAAKAVGKAVAERAKAQGVAKVVFDRGGYPYHGRVKAVAEAAREAGLEF